MSRVNPYFIWYKHCIVIASVLERILAGELRNVMIFLPPRHSKSEQISRGFTAYYLKKRPTHWIGLASYGAELAHGLSTIARDNFMRAGGKVREDVAAKKEWMTSEGGGLWAAGVGGPITGKGFNGGIVDDPIKNIQEAMSDTIREGTNEWYDSTWYTRREPDAWEIIIQTRWHEHDLAGYLLEKENEEPRRWHIVSLDAVHEEESPSYPDTCTIEPDWRKPGEALCPERYDVKALAAIKETVGARNWASLYQRRPRPLEGDIWKRDWFKAFVFDEEMELQDVGYDWDGAYTKDERNSATAYVKAARDAQGNIFVLDFDFKWLEFPDMIKWMVELAGPHHVEQKATGKSAVQTLKANLISAREVKVEGGNDKIGRARLATPPVEMGKVFVAKHLLDRLLNDPRQGLLNFPNGPHDDVNDAFVQAINRLHKKRSFKMYTAGGGNGNGDAESTKPKELEEIERRLRR